MSITNGYCALADIKNRLDLTSTNTTRDGNIEQQVEAASRWIDGACGRRFYAATETHYFAPTACDLAFIDDLLSVTTLKTDENGDGVFETTWSVSDYRLLPRNALVATLPGPYTMIAPHPAGTRVFPVLEGGAESIEIVGSWGYASTVPPAIKEACILKTIQLYRRKDSVGTGKTGNTALGSNKIPSNAEIDELLAPFKRTL